METQTTELREVLIATRRTTRWRVTAFGGLLAGILLTLAFVLPVADFLYKKQGSYFRGKANASTAAHQKELAALNARIEGLNANLAVARKGDPLIFLSNYEADSIKRIETLVDSFPDFKSPRHATAFNQIREEVITQATQSRALRRVLQAAAQSNANLCGRDDTTDDLKPLWSYDSVGFSLAGWRGLPQ